MRLQSHQIARSSAGGAASHGAPSGRVIACGAPFLGLSTDIALASTALHHLRVAASRAVVHHLHLGLYRMKTTFFRAFVHRAPPNPSLERGPSEAGHLGPAPAMAIIVRCRAKAPHLYGPAQLER